MQIALLIIFMLGILIESTIWMFPLTYILLISLSIILNREIYVLVFISGFLLDIFLLRPLGVDSLFFLLAVFIADRYKRKMSLNNVLYPLVYILGTVILYSVIFYKRIDIFMILFSVGIGSIIIFIIKNFFPTLVFSKKKLTV